MAQDTEEQWVVLLGAEYQPKLWVDQNPDFDFADEPFREYFELSSILGSRRGW